jgi:hypothetical protein
LSKIAENRDHIDPRFVPFYWRSNIFTLKSKN